MYADYSPAVPNNSLSPTSAFASPMATLGPGNPSQLISTSIFATNLTPSKTYATGSSAALIANMLNIRSGSRESNTVHHSPATSSAAKSFFLNGPSPLRSGGAAANTYDRIGEEDNERIAWSRPVAQDEKALTPSRSIFAQNLPSPISARTSIPPPALSTYSALGPLQAAAPSLYNKISLNHIIRTNHIAMGAGHASTSRADGLNVDSPLAILNNASPPTPSYSHRLFAATAVINPNARPDPSGADAHEVKFLRNRVATLEEELRYARGDKKYFDHDGELMVRANAIFKSTSYERFLNLNLMRTYYRRWLLYFRLLRRANSKPTIFRISNSEYPDQLVPPSERTDNASTQRTDLALNSSPQEPPIKAFASPNRRMYPDLGIPAHVVNYTQPPLPPLTLVAESTSKSSPHEISGTGTISAPQQPKQPKQSRQLIDQATADEIRFYNEIEALHAQVRDLSLERQDASAMLTATHSYLTHDRHRLDSMELAVGEMAIRVRSIDEAFSNQRHLTAELQRYKEETEAQIERNKQQALRSYEEERAEIVERNEQLRIERELLAKQQAAHEASQDVFRAELQRNEQELRAKGLELLPSQMENLSRHSSHPDMTSNRHSRLPQAIRAGNSPGGIKSELETSPAASSTFLISQSTAESRISPSNWATSAGYVSAPPAARSIVDDHCDPSRPATGIKYNPALRSVSPSTSNLPPSLSRHNSTPNLGSLAVALARGGPALSRSSSPHGGGSSSDPRISPPRSPHGSFTRGDSAVRTPIRGLSGSHLHLESPRRHSEQHTHFPITTTTIEFEGPLQKGARRVAVLLLEQCQRSEELVRKVVANEEDVAFGSLKDYALHSKSRIAFALGTSSRLPSRSNSAMITTDNYGDPLIARWKDQFSSSPLREKYL